VLVDVLAGHEGLEDAKGVAHDNGEVNVSPREQ
jgi:hypothetical protein